MEWHEQCKEWITAPSFHERIEFCSCIIMQPMPRRFQVGHCYKRPRSMSLSSSVDEIDQQELILIAINIMDICSFHGWTTSQRG